MVWGVTLQWKSHSSRAKFLPCTNPSGRSKQKTPVCAAPLPFHLFIFPKKSRIESVHCPLAALFFFFFEYLSGGSGQIVGVQHVEVIPGAQKETTSLLVQQQRVGVEAVGGTQELGNAASLQQLCHTQIKRLFQTFARVRFGFKKKKKFRHSV